MSGSELEYIPRIKAYYKALGYETPYVWAKLRDVAFTRLCRPLAQARIGIVTTAAPFRVEAGDQGPDAPHNGLAKFFNVFANPIEPEPDLRISHIAYDRVHTLALDQRTYFPLRALMAMLEQEVIDSVSPRYYGLPTNRSRRITTNVDGPALVDMCKADGVDGVVLVPNCPVCHHSVALAANALEVAGIATVIMGCARDIVEHVGVPRLLFSNFPLGNGAGLPNDLDSQLETARMALLMLENAKAPRSTQQSSLKWSGAVDWQKDYSNPRMLSGDEIRSRRIAFDAVKEDAKAVTLKIG